MNKFKKILLGVASVLTLGALFTVTGIRSKADVTNDVYKADLTTITQSNKSYVATVEGGNTTMTFTASTNKTGVTGVSGTSLITGSNRDYTDGAKIASTDTVTFTTTHSWSADILFAVKQTSSKVKGLTTSNGNITNPTVSAANTLYTATISSGTAGNVSISRDGDKETWIFEIIVTETYDSSVTYRSVTYYDSDEETVLDTDSVADGSNLTAPSNPVSSRLGQEFDCWVDSNGNEFDFENDTVTGGDLNLYASYTTDSNYSSKIENANKLSNGIIEYMHSQSITSTTREIKVTNTIFSIGNKWDVEYKDSNTNVGGKSFHYDLKVGGKIQKDSQYIKVEAPSKGCLVAYVKNASSSAAATLSIDNYGTQTVVRSASAIDANETAVATIEVPAAGNYSFGISNGNGFYLYELEFIPESVTPLVQKATDETYTYARFVTIIKGVDEISASDVTFSVTMTYANESTKTVEYTPYVVKRITQSGATYVADVNSVSHTFDNSVNPTEYYVVFVLRLTTSKFSGNSVKATTTFGGESYESKPLEI